MTLHPKGDKMKNLIFGIAVSVLTFAAFADTKSPYIGQETREIKALSQQEVEDYLNGKGLGYAKAAELNQYPGPRHVLDMAKELTLTDKQAMQSQVVFDAMQAQAITLGKQLVEKERELDRQFASGSIDAGALKILLSDIGALQAKIRYVHLSAHLEQKALLTQHQIQLYERLRGYGTSHSGGHKHSH
jgi:Spy/CpxP family protein refolding chaperone